ncbi:MAG: iron-sulfur cluster assembly scaffold protein [Paracoccaceae bacterium]|jgi:NifU-like protein involved in Fe-S cluster formation|nr:iron-sulfur cluster assembly scaffold protein [Pseudomonadota bacterium]NCW14443.1 iron-sulfur cluster assembly scaffold protein [Paracoccaceae bacterium]NCW52775.1 iron-sulfur cluster assembly scaffold protein [Paracoccaceae bacterium]NDD09392.1 iron-sulfur cluster assembly scaffold protein [Paracoccaceae bacterium]
MSSENELIKLYSERILALATELPAPARLDKPDGSVKKRSPLCGSTVTVDVKVQNGKISEFAQEVKACALGQASASVIGKSAVGCTITDIQTARDALHDMLKTGAPAPAGPFEGLEVLMPAKDFKNRHASIMLSIEATLEAMKQAEEKENCA